MEILTFSWWYIQVFHKMKIRETDISLIREHCLHLEKEIAEIEITIKAWQENPFLYEQVAREQLCMARDGEEIYYIQ
jgi:hypothetical protein